MIAQLLKHWTIKWIISPIAFVFALGYGWYQYNYPTCTFRYKITAEVETPQGVKSGSSVVEASYYARPNAGGSALHETQLKGDAVFVDLSNGRNVVVSLVGRISSRSLINHVTPNGMWSYTSPLTAELLPLYAFNLDWTIGQERALCTDLNKMRETVGVVPSSDAPTTITFLDVKDPDSVRELTPDTTAMLLPAGFRIRPIKIQATTEQVSSQIDRFFPWWNEKTKLWQRELGVRFVGPKFIDQLGYDAFRGYP